MAAVPSVLSYVKTVSICPATGIEPTPALHSTALLAKLTLMRFYDDVVFTNYSTKVTSIYPAICLRLTLLTFERNLDTCLDQTYDFTFKFANFDLQLLCSDKENETIEGV